MGSMLQPSNLANNLFASSCDSLARSYRPRYIRLIGWCLIGFNFPAALTVELDTILPVGAKKLEVDTALRPEEGDPFRETERKVGKQLAKGVGILNVAKSLGIGTGTVQRISNELRMKRSTAIFCADREVVCASQ